MFIKGLVLSITLVGFVACDVADENDLMSAGQSIGMVPAPANPCLAEGAFEFCSWNSDVPDLDQMRTGDLTRNGKVHCGPTAVADILGYLGGQGLLPEFASYAREPLLDTTELFCSESVGEPLSAELTALCASSRFETEGYHPILDEERGRLKARWDADAYADTSELIRVLGDEMGTTGGTGTSFDSLHAVLSDRVSSVATLTSRRGGNCDGEELPFSPRLLFEEMRAGSVHIMSVGKYTDADGNGLVNRTGGHFIVPTGISKNGSHLRLYFRDPARTAQYGDIDTYRQDTFRQEVGTLTRVTLDHEEDCSRKRWKMVWANGTQTAYFDALITITPTL
jgi:hypothetical protein